MANTGQDYGPGIIGGAAFLLLAKYAADQVPLEEIKSKVDIRPESGEFLGGLFKGAKTKYFYFR